MRRPDILPLPDRRAKATDACSRPRRLGASPWADLPLVSILSPLVVQAMIPVIKAAIDHLPDGKTQVQVSYTDVSLSLSAAMRPSADRTLGASVFASFAALIKWAVASYWPSLQPGWQVKVDLFKRDGIGPRQCGISTIRCFRLRESPDAKSRSASGCDTPAGANTAFEDWRPRKRHQKASLSSPPQYRPAGLL